MLYIYTLLHSFSLMWPPTYFYCVSLFIVSLAKPTVFYVLMPILLFIHLPLFLWPLTALMYLCSFLLIFHIFFGCIHPILYQVSLFVFSVKHLCSCVMQDYSFVLFCSKFILTETCRLLAQCYAYLSFWLCSAHFLFQLFVVTCVA